MRRELTTIDHSCTIAVVYSSSRTVYEAPLHVLMIMPELERFLLNVLHPPPLVAVSSRVVAEMVG